jgi:hypothetical protein
LVWEEEKEGTELLSLEKGRKSVQREATDMTEIMVNVSRKTLFVSFFCFIVQRKKVPQ